MWNDFLLRDYHFSNDKAPSTLKQTAMYNDSTPFRHQRKFNKAVWVRNNRKWCSVGTRVKMTAKCTGWAWCQCQSKHHRLVVRKGHISVRKKGQGALNVTRGEVVITVFRHFTDLKEKKKNNIGEALLHHAKYFSKPSDTDKIYWTGTRHICPATATKPVVILWMWDPYQK